tara:strand:+ start:437 stop:754 length:318 start_codon:yes stop_codon:yes gene_type:complete
MKDTITIYQFRDWFRSSEGYKNNFSYDGLGALFDYIEELEQDIGEDIEFDPIALCCEYSEYASFEELKEDYALVPLHNIESVDDLHDWTTVIHIPDSDGIIIRQF